VIVDRSSRFGNPFTTQQILDTGDATTLNEARTIAVRRYSDWLDGAGPDEYPTRKGRAVDRRWILAHLDDLAGRPLACTCPVDEFPCHRNELARRAAERGVYRERAQLVALLAALFSSSRSIDPGEPMCPDVVYLETEAGQLSWHLLPVDAQAFLSHVDHVGPDHPAASWDGHSTDEKYRRITELIHHLTQQEGTP
jgi:hypothetical protein